VIGTGAALPDFDHRAVSINGFEDHSVNVTGDDQIATYDDSNVFLHRDGAINANTGDTDSSGLNAVDVTYSVVRSGLSTDGGNGGDVVALRAGARAKTPAHPRADGTAAVVDDDSATTATGADPLVIGGDGYDNLGIHAIGHRNIVTYDDSNLVNGGAGKVNAEIGDSDTGGAVVMGIDHSDVAAGPSS
jgi:hypothetical protein